MDLRRPDARVVLADVSESRAVDRVRARAYRRWVLFAQRRTAVASVSISSGFGHDEAVEALRGVIARQQLLLSSKDRLANYLASQRDTAVMASDADQVRVISDLRDRVAVLERRLRKHETQPLPWVDEAPVPLKAAASPSDVRTKRRTKPAATPPDPPVDEACVAVSPVRSARAAPTIEPSNIAPLRRNESPCESVDDETPIEDMPRPGSEAAQPAPPTCTRPVQPGTAPAADVDARLMLRGVARPTPDALQILMPASLHPRSLVKPAAQQKPRSTQPVSRSAGYRVQPQKQPAFGVAPARRK